MRPIASVALLAAALVVAPVAQAEDVAALIPADAVAVVVVDDINQLEADVQAFGQSIGTPVPPGMLDFAPQLLQLNPDQWDRTRPLAAVVMGLEQAVLFVPVSQELAESLDQTGVPKLDGVYGLGFASGVIRDNYLILGPSAEHVRSFRTAPAETIAAAWQGDVATARGEGDVFYWVNFERLRPIAAEGFKAMEAQTREAFQDLPDEFELPPDFIEQQVRSQRLMARLTDGLLGLGHVYYGSLDIEAERIRDSGRLVPRDGSPTAQWLSGLQPPWAKLLDRVPAGDLYMAAGMDGPALKEPFKRMVHAMFSDPDFRELAEIDEIEDMDRFNELFDQMLDSQVFQFTMDIGDTFSASFWYGYKDPAAAFAANQALMREFPQVYSGGEDETVRLVPVDDAEPVLGLPTYRLRFVVKEQADDEFEAIALEATRAMFGENPEMVMVQLPEGLGGVLGRPVEEIAAIRDRTLKPLGDAPRIQRVMDDLEGQTLAVVLLDPLAYVRMLAGQFGQNLGVGGFELELPKEPPPPWRFALTKHDGRLGVETRVEAANIKALIDAFKSVNPFGGIGDEPGGQDLDL